MDRQTDRQIDRQTDRQTNIQAHTDRDGHADRRTGEETDM